MKGSATSVVGIIPARAGSKGVKGKNRKVLGGKPLIEYTFEAARGARRLSRYIVTTDDPELIKLAEQAGIEVPFTRPSHLAADDTPMLKVIEHTLAWMEANDDEIPDVLVLLQPTCPFRRSADIDAVVDLLLERSADSAVAVRAVPGEYNPLWQFTMVDEMLAPYWVDSLGELPTRRQNLPRTYTRNGAVYAFRPSNLRSGSMYGDTCVAYEMPPERSVNIDTEEDWNSAEALLSLFGDGPDAK